MIVALGSESPIKITAVRRALTSLGFHDDVRPVASASGVQEQPASLEEATRGARNRALGAWREVAPGGGPSLVVAVGVESGLIFLATGAYVDVAVVVLRAPEGEFLATSAGVMLGAGDVESLRSSGLAGQTAQTAVERLASRTGCDPRDPHSWLTWGEFSRADLIEQAVAIAISQWSSRRVLGVTGAEVGS